MLTWTDDWHHHFLAEAELISHRSKDPSTKCGAVIVRPNKTIVSKGYNGFPRGVKDTPEVYADRNEKYRRVVHAEMNAVLSAHQSVEGCGLYVWPFLTCERCCVHMIQAGIQYVFAPQNDNPRWQESFRLACELYNEAGVIVRFFDDYR